MQEIVQRIVGSVGALRNQATFQTWLNGVSISSGDTIQLNNSFIDRTGIKSNKNELFLFLATDRDGAIEAVPRVGRGNAMNMDFRLLSSKAKNTAVPDPLTDMIDTQREALGKLVFILVGSVLDDVVIREPVSHALLAEIVLDPGAADLVALKDRILTVRDTFDEDGIWEQAEKSVEASAEELEGLRKALGATIAKLGDSSYARVLLPGSGQTGGGGSVLGDVSHVLKEQRDAYEQALDKCNGDGEGDRQAFNELLRISYNFSSDATGLIRLVVSICDLKEPLHDSVGRCDI